MKAFNQHAFIIFTLLFLGCCITLFVGLPLSWDGSFHFVQIVQNNEWFIGHNRLFVYFLQLPIRIALKFTSNIQILKATYGIVYSFIPFIALLISYLLIDKNKIAQFFYCGTGITLPYIQASCHPISEHLIACQLFIPLLINIINRPKYYYFWLTVLSLSLFYLHPASIVLFIFLLVIIGHKNKRYSISDKMIHYFGFSVLIIARFYLLISNPYAGVITLPTVYVTMTCIRYLTTYTMYPALFISIVLLLKGHTLSVKKIIALFVVLIILHIAYSIYDTENLINTLGMRHLDSFLLIPVILMILQSDAAPFTENSYLNYFLMCSLSIMCFVIMQFTNGMVFKNDIHTIDQIAQESNQKCYDFSQEYKIKNSVTTWAIGYNYLVYKNEIKPKLFVTSSKGGCEKLYSSDNKYIYLGALENQVKVTGIYELRDQ